MNALGGSARKGGSNLTRKWTPSPVNKCMLYIFTQGLLLIQLFVLQSTPMVGCSRLHNELREAPMCQPIISDSTKDEDTHRKLECDLSTCDMRSRVIFEKANVVKHKKWTQVFEGINNTHYHAVDTSVEYSLVNRTEYIAFKTKHILHIMPVLPTDQGKWRCVVYEANDVKYESFELQILIHAIAWIIEPLEDAVITPQYEPFTLYCIWGGQRLSISWQKDNKRILDNDTRYTTDDRCKVNVCISKLTSAKSPCLDSKQYTGVYACVISSQSYMYSAHVSANSVVSPALCGGKHFGTFGFAALGVVIGVSGVALVVLGFVCTSFRGLAPTTKCASRKNGSEDSKNESQMASMIDKEMTRQ